jgi:hypothetical protein
MRCLPASFRQVMLPDAATVAIVPPPQVPTKPFGVGPRARRARSVKPMPVRAVAALGLAMVKLSEVAPRAECCRAEALRDRGR